MSRISCSNNGVGFDLFPWDPTNPVTFDIDVEVGQTVRIIDGAFADYTGKITEIDNNKVKMIISMFGNDTVAEVNLNQIAEL